MKQPDPDCGLCNGRGEYDESRPCSPSEATGGMSEETRTVGCPCVADMAHGPCENSQDGFHDAGPGELCGACGLWVPDQNPRQRGDDDGVEYADPRDEIAERMERD